MTIHQHESGIIEMLDQWGHGRAPHGDWNNRPATLIYDDDDGHFTAWNYTGHIRDAAMKIASLGREFGDTVVWVLDGNRVRPARRDEWADGVEVIVKDDDGEPLEYEFFPEKQPGGLCLG